MARCSESSRVQYGVKRDLNLTMPKNTSQMWIGSGISLEPGDTEAPAYTDTNVALSHTNIKEKGDACSGEGKGTSSGLPNKPQPYDELHHMKC